MIMTVGSGLLDAPWAYGNRRSAGFSEVLFVGAGGAGQQRSSEHPWEAWLPVDEAVARLMTIHLDESLAPRSRHETGWWSYDGAQFHPVPPWEVQHHRHER